MLLHPPKSEDGNGQLTKVAFKINDFLWNPHFRHLVSLLIKTINNFCRWHFYFEGWIMDQGQICILNWNLPSKKHISYLNSLFLLTLGIPGKALTAEDTDPETKCQNTCGQHEICQINHDGILCKCRPGYGRNSKTDSLCESKNT